MKEDNKYYTYVESEGQIISAIKSCLTKYRSKVKIAPNYYFNMHDTVNLITLYSSSKFLTGDIDSLGNKKYFFNVLNPMCDNASKNIDIDSKDIIVQAENPKYRIPAMLYNKKLKEYNKKNGIGLLLNDAVWGLPRDGSVIIKKDLLDGIIKQVELRYAIMDPAVENRKGKFDIISDFFIEPHVMNISLFDDMVETDWNQKAIKDIQDRIIGRLAQGPSNIPDIRVLECYMIMPNKLFTKGAKGYSDYLIYATVNDADDELSLGIESVLYFKKGIKKPYKKVDYKTIVGRALGFGLMEGGFDAQERFNEMHNQLAGAMRSLTKTNYQTRDKNVASNILTDTLDGEVIKINSELTLVPNEKRDLSSFQTTMQSWMDNLRQNSQATEVLTGETMPADTAYRTVQQLAVAGGKFFDLVRENLSLFFSEVFNDWVIPDFEKELKGDKTILLDDADLYAELVQMEADRKISEAVVKYMQSTGKTPSAQEIDALKVSLVQNASKNIDIEIGDDFFNFEKHLFIDVSGESHNVQRQTESMINALTQISNNPGILTDPVVFKLFSAILENTGVDLDILNRPGAISSAAAAPATPAPAPTPVAGQPVPSSSASAGGAPVVPSNTELGRTKSLGAGGSESTLVK